MTELLIPLLQVVGGLALLVAGGEALVRGAVALANSLGIPALVIGLTIVSFGTSLPEMVVSVGAALEGYPALSLGNIIGSNIANILIILGVSAMIYPITVDPNIMKRDTPLLVLITLIFIAFCWDGAISRIEASAFVLFIVGYTVYIFRTAKNGYDPELVHEMEEETAVKLPTWKAVALIVGGLALLIVGSDILIDGAIVTARLLGVSEAVIGLTIVAIGTSSPELITSVLAARRKHSDIALGNIIGSNLFNLTAIGGVTGVIMPIPVAEQFLAFDNWVMLGVTLLLAALMFTGKKLVRPEGAALLLGYVVYAVWLYYHPQG